jgi:hypothetical protein
MEARGKWAGGSTGAVRCAVEDCDARAVATLRVDPAATRAWLVDIVGGHDGGTGEEVCARHAEALAASEGWVVHDARDRAARLDPSVDSALRSRALRAVGQRVPRVDLRRRLPEAPGPPGDLLDAQSPLLRQAFAKARGA